MIVELKNTVGKERVKELIDFYDALSFEDDEKVTVIASSSVKSIDPKFEDIILKVSYFKSDIQLASKDYLSNREIVLGNGLVIGGSSQNTVVIAGPCSVESEEQIFNTGRFLKRIGISVLRGGCYKPRTSPYSFQGLAERGLELLNKVKNETGQLIITEVRDATHVHEVIEATDIIQIGAKAMYDHGILKACSQVKKPVMIKRGFGTTLQEFVQAAEFVLSGGNPNVILCERGIRTFETKTRFTLDLCGVSYLKEFTNLPVILDPSHAMGFSYGIGDLSKACTAMGVDGLIIEVHPDPSIAKSDASQQLSFEQFEELFESLKPVANSVAKRII